MSGTTKPEAGKGEMRLLPAKLADLQLDHMERVARQLCLSAGESAPECLERQYWIARLKAIEDAHFLVASQRTRIAKLREMLAS